MAATFTGSYSQCIRYALCYRTFQPSHDIHVTDVEVVGPEAKEDRTDHTEQNPKFKPGRETVRSAVVLM